MINVTVTGTSLADCHDQILTMAEEVKAFKRSKEAPSVANPVTQFAPPPQAPIHQAPVFQAPPAPTAVVPLTQAEIEFKNRAAQAPQQGADPTHDSRGVPWMAEVHSANKEITVKGVWRKRRGVDDTQHALAEAPYLGKTAAAPSYSPPPVSAPQQPVYQTPPTPTTQHRVAMPEAGSVLGEMNLGQAPVAVAPMMPPFKQPTAPNAYTLETFKQNMVGILNRLADEKKLDHTWINQTRVQAFGGKEIYNWQQDHEASSMLFDMFANEGFITKV